MEKITDEELKKILDKEFNSLKTREDCVRFLNSRFLESIGEPLYKNRYPMYKKNKNDTIWWVHFMGEKQGEYVFTFDRKTFHQLYTGKNSQLTEEEKEIFKNENPLLSHWIDCY